MDDQSNQKLIKDVVALVEVPKPVASAEGGDITIFSQREQAVLAQVEIDGIRPYGPTIALQMYQLFLEGYTCKDIAEANITLKAREGDVLFLRKKYNWDEARDLYMYNLQNQTNFRLTKANYDLLEFAHLQLAVANKEFKEKAQRYLQTGKEEDKPDHMLGTIAAYKSLVETIQKITGQDRVMNHNIRSESKVTVESNQPITVINPELQTKMLKKLALSEKKKDENDNG